MSTLKKKSPHFRKNVSDDTHFKLLREQVNLKVDSLPASRLIVARAKAFVLPAIYFGVYILALFQTEYIWFCATYSFLGFMLIILFLNLIHEASHHNLFKAKRANEIYMLLFDILGANSYMWNKRHIWFHHNFPNVDGWDTDIEKSKFLKVHSGTKEKKGHRHQQLILLLYPLFITNWFFIRDFKDFFKPHTIVRKIGDVPLKEYFKLFFFKISLIGYLVVVPAFLTPFSAVQTFFGLLVFLVTAGIVGLAVLVPPHANVKNQFHVADDQMNLPHSWLLHQLNTTNDVIESNWFTRHVMANSNFHISHHLFPNISYVYAPEVTEVIREYNLEAGLPYKCYPMASTFKNHYKLVKENARLYNLLDEDM